MIVAGVSYFRDDGGVFAKPADRTAEVQPFHNPLYDGYNTGGGGGGEPLPSIYSMPLATLHASTSFVPSVNPAAAPVPAGAKGRAGAAGGATGAAAGTGAAAASSGPLPSIFSLPAATVRATTSAVPAANGAQLAGKGGAPAAAVAAAAAPPHSQRSLRLAGVSEGASSADGRRSSAANVAVDDDDEPVNSINFGVPSVLNPHAARNPLFGSDFPSMPGQAEDYGAEGGEDGYLDVGHEAEMIAEEMHNSYGFGDVTGEEWHA